MAFSTKRGRPSVKIHDRSDLGTPELIKKRLLDITAEAIDICLDKDLITAQQHWCGIHLRWLYTLRYGVPSVKALDPTHLGGRELNCDNPEWRKEREREYNEALLAMRYPLIIRAVLELCVFNQRPVFLHVHAAPTTLKNAKRLAERQKYEISLIHTGLDTLVKHWCRKPISSRRDNPSGQ